MSENNTSLEKEILDRIEAIGEAKAIISYHWQTDYPECHYLQDLSKHNEWFDSPHEEESEKLFECRRRLHYYENLLENICNTLCREE